MTEIVLGVGASHSTLMNTHWEETFHKDRAERFRDALAEAREDLAAARPDTVILVGSNHFRGFWLDLIPSFTIGVGECIASGESGTPKGPLPVDIPLARHLANSLVEEGGFDPAFSARLQIDHGQSHAVQYLLKDLDVELVPIVVNVFAPPYPPSNAASSWAGRSGTPYWPSLGTAGSRWSDPADFRTGCPGRTGANRRARTRSSWSAPG